MIDIGVVIIGAFSLLPFLVHRFTGKYIHFVIFALLAVIFHGLYFFGLNILFLLFVTFVISTVAELVSLKTSLYCFGVKYRYDIHHNFFSSNVNLLGVYPIEVVLTWIIFKYISFALVLIIASALSLPIILEVVFIPLVLVSLDFIIDPVAVNQSKLWSWERGSNYFGIPVQNFIGWYLVGLVSTVLFVVFNTWKPLSFHVLLLLPLLLYGSFLRHAPILIKMNKQQGILGIVPVAFWTVVSFASLVLLFLRSH